MFELGELELDTLTEIIGDTEISTQENQYDSDQYVDDGLNHLLDLEHTNIDFDEFALHNNLFSDTHRDEDFQKSNIFFNNFCSNVFHLNF